MTGMSQPAFGLEINATISLLNLVCIMNHDQFHRVFPGQAADRLLQVMDEVMQLAAQYNKVQQMKTTAPQFIPSILKAAIIKTYGYLI